MIVGSEQRSAIDEAEGNAPAHRASSVQTRAEYDLLHTCVSVVIGGLGHE